MKHFQKTLSFALAFLTPMICSSQGLSSKPVGTFDRIQDFIAYGWSYDPDFPSQSIQVQFFVDATDSTGLFAGSTLTDVLREDVNTTYGITGKHGFRWFIPQRFRDGLEHTLYVYGVDASDTTIGVMLNQSPKTFQVPPSPCIQSEQPYNIGAWYFTAWSPLDSFHIANTLLVYGREDVWGGVRDHALGADPWGLHTDYSNRQPLLGFYNLMDQDVMDQHILQAASRGLSFFAFYWYWNSDLNQEDGISTPLKKFISSPLKTKLKFLIAPIKLGTKPMTLSMWKDHVVPYIVHNYIVDSSYLRTDDGRPILVLFDLGFNNNADLSSAINLLRDSVIAVARKNPVLLWLYQDGHTSLDLEYFLTSFHVEGFASFQLGPNQPAEPYDSTLSRWTTFTSVQQGFFHITCASTGFDRRPWWKIGWGYPGEGVNDRPYNIGISLTSFADHLRTVKHYMDSHATETSKTLIVYAWNEWGEGGIIEPSVLYRYQYLDSIKSIFGLFSTIIAAPAAPSLASPANGATGVSTSPTLSWNASTGATFYRLQVSTDSTFSSLVYDQTGITDTSQQVSGLAENTLHYWRVNATNLGGTSSYSSTWSFITTGPTSVEQVASDIPRTYALYQNYPNPFNPVTTIQFSLPKESSVKLTIFNSLGMRIETLVNEHLPPGHYRTQWTPRNIPSGLYFYQLKSVEFTNTKKLLLLR